MNSKELEKIALSALENVYHIHQTLGKSGEELVEKNQFGDTALKVDIEAEKAVIETLRKNNVPIKIISEEHGTVIIGDNPIYLGILDGLDGSNVYKKSRGTGRYATMFGIFSGLDPIYDDYLFSGIMEHSNKRLLYASKNKGSFVKEGDIIKPIHCSGCKELDSKTKIYIDEKENDQKWHPFMKKTFTNHLQGFNLTWLGSSAIYYVDLSCGESDIVLECTRKGNLEIAIAYGLETESCAVMMTLDGQNLGQKKYLSFAQDKDNYVPIISASTRKLAEDLIEHIKNN